ncbi:hypothetical protein [Trichodesmium erythraeum]|uniref:hypothetical protein n=1 Tax=Trichodesmium erythraeum TaxID=1206 RepID=UPI0012DD6235
MEEKFPCLGDEDDGVWDIFVTLGTAQQREEILECYHNYGKLIQSARNSSAAGSSVKLSLARSVH